MKRYLAATVLGLIALAAIAGTTRAVSPPAPVPPVSADAGTPGAEVWPMPVESFLAGSYLERADVVLTRRDWDLASWLIRWATNSPFSHAAMVFTGPQFESGFSNTFVIEAGTGGVDLTNLRDYIADRSAFLAVKRFNRKWFDATKRARVRGLLLDKIKSTYNYWALAHIARNLWFGVERSVRGDKTTIKSYRERAWNAPNEYICSGLVQIGFVEAVLEYIKSGQLPPSALNDVVFEPVAATRLPEKNDWSLAASDKLEWLYFIKDGLVYKVSSYDDVKKLVGG
jgi:hypothetical protein